MKECKAATFVKLAEYRTIHPPAQVLLAEAVCTILFGSLNLASFRSLRGTELPGISWSKGLNRSNPLGESTTESIGIDAVLRARQRGLLKCQQKSNYSVSYYHDAKAYEERYTFDLFAFSFRISTPLARAWNLKDDRNIDVA